MEHLKEINLIHSGIGFFHTLVATLAMVFGTIVLVNPKGTKKHRQLGYGYVASMALMLISSFWMYNFGGLSLFHGFSVVSTATLIAGIYPTIKRSKGWYAKHYYFMSWSVLGLYGAFWSEIGTRLLEMQYFWWAVMAATFATVLVGSIVIKRNAKKFGLD